MPTGDPRQAKVVTSWYPRDDKIYFDETGQYQFRVSGSNCTASVRRTRVLTRVVKKSDPSALDKTPSTQSSTPAGSKSTAQNESTPDRPPSPQRASRCAKPGNATQMEVTPSSKLMRLGESFQFQAVARDARGCRVPIRTQWSLESGEGVRLGSQGLLEVAENAPPGKVTLKAQVGEQSVEVFAQVVTDQEYESLIAGGQYGAQGESLEVAKVELASSHVEFERQAPVVPAASGKVLWLSLVGGLVVLFGGLSVYLVRRQRNAPASPGERPADSAKAEGSGSLAVREEALSATMAAPEAEASSPQRLCPVCGRRYEDGTIFCVDDGARLMRMN